MHKIRICRPSADTSFLSEIHPILARVYAARNIRSLADLDYRLDCLLHYRDLKGINEAAVFLAMALREQRRLLVIGDFDSDGATSSALAVSALRQFGAQHVDYLVPNRFEYGYGLTPEIVQVALATKKPDLILTVDNGISSYEGVNEANKAGVEVIITDHHLPGLCLPAAAAIVNPQQEGDTFKSKNLAGVGVVFYLMLALRRTLREKKWFANKKSSEPNMLQFLDLVALGTIADLVTLDHNNRLMVYQGLRWIKAGKARPGIYALLKLAKRKIECLTASDIAFNLAPRLNAAGRLADMSLGVSCLLSDEINDAYEKALKLSQLNEERRSIEAKMQRDAFIAVDKIIEQKFIEPGICLFDPQWHQGVIGLLASRVTERLHRPSIIFALSERCDEIKGSARSIAGVHIRDILESIAVKEPQLISKFGGHAMAAGLTLKRKAFTRFVKVFQSCLAQRLDDEILKRKCYTDGKLAEQDLNLELAELLCYQAGPWGQGFPEPLFEGQFKLLSQRLVGNKHLKMTLSFIDSPRQIEAIAFNVNLREWPNHRVEEIVITYRLTINDYQDRKQLQLVVLTLEKI